MVCLGLSGAILMLFPRIFRGVALDVATLIMCGLTLSSYIQMLFLNGGMVLLTGGVVGYDKITLARSLNMAAWAVMTFLPLCIWKWFRNGKKHRNWKWETGVVCISMIVMGMQVAGVAAAAPRYDTSGIMNIGKS